MKKCAHCKKKIIDDTDHCYYCGRDQNQKYDTPVEVKQEQKKTLNSYALAGFILSLVSIVMGSFLLFQIIAFYLGFKGLGTFDTDEDKGVWMCWATMIISGATIVIYFAFWIIILVAVMGNSEPFFLEYIPEYSNINN